MGCDIHLYTEKWNETKECWESFDFYERNEYYNPNPETEEEIEDNEGERPFAVVSIDQSRWYYKFAILSPHVRIPPNELKGPVAKDRGFPDDAHKELAEDFKLWDCDAHSPNWMTVAEFRDLACKWRLIETDSPLAEMSKNLETHIKRKLKWPNLIEKQNMDHIRLVYWFDN